MSTTQNILTSTFLLIKLSIAKSCTSYNCSQSYCEINDNHTVVFIGNHNPKHVFCVNIFHCVINKELMINQVAGAEKITGGDGFGIKDLTFPPFTKHIIKSLIKLHIQIGLYKKEED